MARLYSKELKALVVADNFLDNPQNVLKEHCMTIQRFDYQCERRRNGSGDVYGPVEPVILSFSVRVNSKYQAKVFYQNLMDNASNVYSFLFNVSFGSNQRVDGYEDGMVVNGYVVSVDENYNSERHSSEDNEQVLLNVKLLVRSVTYLGNERQNNLESVFIQ